MRRVVVLGKKIENIYSVDSKKTEVKDDNNGFKIVYTDKPCLVKQSEVKEWVEICSYKGEPRYNIAEAHPFSLYSSRMTNCLNISEDEVVTVKAEIFRADLNEIHIRTDKVVEEVDFEKESSKMILSDEVRAFNEMMITSNDKLKSYCDIHKLSYGNTDAIELFKIVYPGEQYKIENGVMSVSGQYVYVSSANDGVGYSIKSSFEKYLTDNKFTVGTICLD